jgi:hypothetical protein
MRSVLTFIMLNICSERRRPRHTARLLVAGKGYVSSAWGLVAAKQGMQGVGYKASCREFLVLSASMERLATLQDCSKTCRRKRCKNKNS